MKSHLYLSRPFLAVFSSILLLAAAAPTALAGTETVDTKTATTPPPPDKFLESFVAFTATNYFESSLEGFPLSLSVTRYSIYSEIKFRLSHEWMLKFHPYGDLSLYSFSNDAPFAPPASFTRNLRNAYMLNLDTTLAYMFAPGWSIVGGGRISSGASTEANFSDSITGGGILAIKKSFFNNAVDLTVGASYTSRLSRSWQVLPYLDFDVNVLPSFVKIPINLRLLYNGALLSYRVTDNLALTLQGRYDSRAYRLPALIQTGTFTALPKAVWYERGIELGGGFTYAPRRQNWAFSVIGGVEVARNVQIFANNGSKFLDQDVNPTPFMSATFHAAF
jgi:hypothetical protein